MQIKKGLEQEYKEYVEKNQDPYGKCAVDAGESVGNALDNGKRPEEAIDALHEHKELTGFLAGCAIQGVCHFHPRGDELKIAWNSKYGVGGKEKGVVNPAIITINDDSR